MSTATRTSVATRVETAVFLTDVITGAFSAIIATLGLSSSYLDASWDVIERGLTAWIAEGSLETVHLEFGPSDRPLARFEIPLDYSYSGEGNAEFVTNRARLARLMAKIEYLPAGTNYRVVVSYNGPHSSVTGWSHTTLSSGEGMSSYSLGGLGRGPGAAASLRYLSRS
jgi:hypothetical protein